MPLKDYRNAAVEILELDTVPEDETPLTRARPRDVNRWFKQRWNHVAQGMLGRGNLADDTIDALLAGRHPLQQNHLEVMHRVLRLDAYGLSVEEMWRVPGETKLRLSLEEFKRRLSEARKTPLDPLHNIRLRAGPHLGLDIRVLDLNPSVPGPGLIFMEAEGRAPASPARIIRSGSPIDVSVVPQVQGRILILSHVIARKQTFILNELLAQPRSADFSAYRAFTFPRKNATGEPGEREVIAINWPEGRNLAAANLDRLFRRSDSSIEDNELRSIGAALLENPDLPEKDRVHAAILPIRIE